MNKNTYDKLVNLAPMLEQFKVLETHEQAWLKPLLHKTAITALKVMELLEKRERTYEEIADDLQIHPTTAQQICNALAEGGSRISITGKTAVCATGRLRVLKRVV